MVNVICIKWGSLYGPHYVNRLYAMVRRHLHRPFRFVCFTQEADGLHPQIDVRPPPPITLPDSHKDKPWRKIGLFASPLSDLTGPTLFLDLDLVVVADLDPLFDHPGRFCIIHNWTRPDQRVGNSSVYRFQAGGHGDVLERFYSQPFSHWHGLYRNSQTFLSASVGDLTFWPPEWCVSFKRHCLPGGWRNWVRMARVPPGARVVVFHGHPNPDDALAGRWPGGIHKQLRPARWIADHWHDRDLPPAARPAHLSPQPHPAAAPAGPTPTGSTDAR